MRKNVKSNFYEYTFKNDSNQYVIELLQYEINKRIYYYGNNFIKPWEKQSVKRNKLKEILINTYKNIKSKSVKKTEKLILSNAYFTVNNKINESQYNVVIPWWTVKKTGIYISKNNYLNLFFEIYKVVNVGGINELLSENFIKKVIDFIEISNKLILSFDFRAAIFSNDLGFFERLFIDIFKNHKIPTFIFLHGLPARYNDIDDNRSDYLIVWGNKIKENYIKAGVDRHKIIVAGHPNYSKFLLKDLKFSFDNILVISKAINGSPSISNNIILSDRGNCLLYLELVKKVLLKFGIVNVKLRVHPSENSNWYKANIDNNFYSIDQDNLSNTLKKSTLVIGPTSTVFLESIYWGVNYLIFEPSNHKVDLMNYSIVPPFDGNDYNIPVAKNQQELEMLISKKESINSKVIKDYINSKFDFSEVYNIIKDAK